MKCLRCGGKLGTVQTSHLQDRIWRQRRCRDEACGWTTSTQEVSDRWFKEAAALMSGKEAAEVVQLARPLATPPAGELADLEAMLDEKIVDAVECIGRALAEGAKPDRTQSEIARWLIDDRRAYRRELAGSTGGGDDEGDNLLALLPVVKEG